MAQRRSRRTRSLVWVACAGLATLSLSILPSWASTTGAEPSVLRINSGGPSIVDSIGRTWKADAYAIGGRSHTTSKPIAGTQDDKLFQSERWDVDGYDIPIANGNYTLQLLFAEINPSSGKRVMNVTVDNKTALSNFQIATAVGNFRSLVQRIPITISDGMLRIRMSAIANVTSIAGIELLKRSSSTPQPSPSPTTTTKPPVVTPDGWRLVTSDDFNGSSVNTGIWAFYKGAGNEGIGLRSPTHVKMSNGTLEIVGSGNTGGGVAMKLDQTYGRWVIRARQDKGSGYGPAMLLWPQSERWPVDGEIDIAEIPKGERARSYFTVHWGSDNKTESRATDGDFSQWHTWTLEWTAASIKLWIDDKLIHTITDRAAIPDKPMHLALQNDVGASGHWIPQRNAQTPATVSLHVDSVKVYQK